jgi:hypothetical protein
MLAGLAMSATGFACYPLIREPWEAIVLTGLAGAGTGTWSRDTGGHVRSG